MHERTDRQIANINFIFEDFNYLSVGAVATLVHKQTPDWRRSSREWRVIVAADLFLVCTGDVAALSVAAQRRYANPPANRLCNANHITIESPVIVSLCVCTVNFLFVSFTESFVI